MSFKLNNIKQWNGEDIVAGDFGTEAYGTFIDSTRTQIEVFKFDPATIADESITILARGLSYNGSDVSDPSRQFAWPSNDTTVQLGTDAPQLFRDFLTESNTATVIAKHTYLELPETAVDPTDDDDFTRKEYVDYKAVTAKAIRVTQASHGFTVGQVVRYTDASNYALAQADTAEHAEVAGIVTEVHSVSEFSFTTEGLVTAGVPVATANTTVFLSPTVAGALQTTEPTTAGEVSAPLGVVLVSGTSMNFHRHRPYVVGGSYVATLPPQTGNNGKFLKTDGNTATWENVPGGGDLLASNNLSEVANPATARQNLGVEIGVDVVAYDVKFDDILVGSYPVDGTPDTDLTTNGPYIESFNAGEAIANRDVVYLGTDQKWYRAIANASATSTGLLGIANTAGTTNNPIRVSLHGSFVRNDAWAWTPGATLYVSNASQGQMTMTAPVTVGHIIRVLGWAVNQDVVCFTPSPNHLVKA
jgi:hypothetical protein